MENQNDKLEESPQNQRENAAYINIRYIYVDAAHNVVSATTGKGKANAKASAKANAKAKANANKVGGDRHDLITFNDKSILSRESVLHIIQNNKKIDGHAGKFALFKILLYNIDIEPQNVQAFTDINRDNDLDIPAPCPFLKELAFTDDIQIDPSLPVFHPVNCLYFIYQEISLDKKKKNKTKKMKMVIAKNRKTKKKVTINESDTTKY